MTATAEAERTRQLAAAEEKAEALFVAVTERGLVAPGLRESQVSDAVRDLGAELFGTRKHWHKRVVRSGPNTLQPYRENPPDDTIERAIAFCASQGIEILTIQRKAPSFPYAVFIAFM